MKSFREFIDELKKNNQIIQIKKPISKNLDLAGLLKELDGKPVIAEHISENKDAIVAGNIFSTKDLICQYYGIKKEQLIPNLIKAIAHPTTPKQIQTKDSPVFEKTISNPNLDDLPIPTHAQKDGGPYFSSAVVISKDKELGQNCSFHRMMQISKNEMVARILERHTDEFIKRNGGTLDVAIVIGAPINFLLASAISTKIGIDETHIANSLAPIRVVNLENEIFVPADAEFVLEATITNEFHDEGPFIDLTETYDVVRKQRIVKINKIHHRKNPIYHALLPGALEHKLLMGMPKEPTIFMEVNKVATCTGVNITPGGCSWLHAIVSINKKQEGDAKKAIAACFEGHKSLKHAVIVDSDINIYDPTEVEWAIATRCQADKDVIIKLNEKGSSLDPSADPNTRKTAKMGIDATKPLIVHGKNFERASWKKISSDNYV